MLCVVFISIGGGGASSGEEKKNEDGVELTPEDANMYLYLSVMASLMAGFILSVNTLSL